MTVHTSIGIAFGHCIIRLHSIWGRHSQRHTSWRSKRNQAFLGVMVLHKYKHWIWIWVWTGESTDPVLGGKGVEVTLLVYKFHIVG